ncbi:hypothetical protein ABFY27_01280 [Akkermansia massiliensis]
MIRLRDITKVYHLGEIDLQVLKGITLDIKEGNSSPSRGLPVPESPP